MYFQVVTTSFISIRSSSPKVGLVLRMLFQFIIRSLTIVNDLMMNWNNILKTKPTFGEEERIDMKEVVTTWKYMEVDTEDYGFKKANKRTRIGLIASSMRLLETEGLIVILDRDDIPKVIPKNELFERIEYLYHDYDRYELFKKLMTTEEDQHAENPSN